MSTDNLDASTHTPYGGGAYTQKELHLKSHTISLSSPYLCYLHNVVNTTTSRSPHLSPLGLSFFKRLSLLFLSEAGPALLSTGFFVGKKQNKLDKSHLLLSSQSPDIRLEYSRRNKNVVQSLYLLQRLQRDSATWNFQNCMSRESVKEVIKMFHKAQSYQYIE